MNEQPELTVVDELSDEGPTPGRSSTPGGSGRSGPGPWMSASGPPKRLDRSCPPPGGSLGNSGTSV